MKVLVFSIGEKDYGVDITQVREVIRKKKVTPVPETAAFVEGVFSSRGRVIPLINLRKKLGMTSEEVSSGRVIITTIRDHWTGILVDQVKAIITLEPGAVTRPDEMLQGAGYFVGVARWKGQLVLLIDLPGFLKVEEIGTLQRVQERVEIRKKES